MSGQRGSVLNDAAGAVTEYYDRNTKKFLRFGHGGADLSIHRAVWGPGVTDRSGAMHFVDECILKTAKKNNTGRFVDLGCGCGGSLIYMEQFYPAASYFGITISSVQKEWGERLINSLGLHASLYTGSYLDRNFYRSVGVPRKKSESPSLFFAVESFIHCPDPKRFFTVLEEATMPGDLLVICDDFIVRQPQHGRQKRFLKEFISGWRAVNAMGPDRLLRLAEKHFFQIKEQSDFTSMLELSRPRDRLIRFIIPFLRIIGPKRPYFGNLLGGNALQRLLLEGNLGYRFIILERARP